MVHTMQYFMILRSALPSFKALTGRRKESVSITQLSFVFQILLTTFAHHFLKNFDYVGLALENYPKK